ncbi:MAG: TolC family protein [Bryobacteraceae bacterium]
MSALFKCVASLAISALVAAAAEAPGSGELTLQDAVKYALEHSPDLKSDGVEVTRREGLVTVARSSRMPQLELAADAARLRFEHGYPAGTSPALLRFDNTLYTAAAELKILAWDFHKTEMEIAAARARVLAASSAVERKRQEVVFETARLFLQSMTYTDLIRSTGAGIESLQALLDRTNQLVAAGRAVPVDALKIRTRLAQLESDLAALRSAHRSSLSALASVMGYDGDLPALRYSPASPSPSEPPAAESAMLARAVSSRPEIRSLDHEIQAGASGLSAVRKSAWPRIDLRASAIQYGSNTPVGFPQLIGGMLPSLAIEAPSPGNAATDWVLGAHLSFPLFDGNRRRGQEQEAAARLEQLHLARRQLELRISREVRTAMADLASAQGRVAALRDSVAESERVLHDERLKFEAGRGVINFVLDAESALLTSQSLLSQAQRSVSIAELTLDLALGRLQADRLPIGR